MNNYQPISIISTFAKVYEMLIMQDLLPYVSSVIPDVQHGFLRGCSTATNLITFTQNLYQAVSTGGQVDLIETDFLQAFDKVILNYSSNA